MTQNDSAVTESQENKISVTNLTMMEEVVNAYAEKYAAKYHVKSGDFHVNLVTSLPRKGELMVVGGPIVEIFLVWPDAQPNINTLLHDAFTCMKRFRMKETVALVPFALIRQHAEAVKKWKKEVFGEFSELLDELIPWRRLRVTFETTMTVTDAKTGISVKVTCSDRDVEESLQKQAWFKISRLVREQERAHGE